MTFYAEYLAFARRQLYFLGFGFILTFTSSAGQTYFIGVFGPEIRQTFNLSHTDWGLYYMIGTLSSALILPWSGNLIDRISLQRYTLIAVLGLVVACFAISISYHIVALIFAIFLLRQFGQGLTSHTAITTMARYMDKNRGKAIAITAMGYSAGEALLPVTAVTMITLFGWRTTYQMTAVAVFILLVMALWLLKRYQINLNQTVNSHADADPATALPILSKSRRQMLVEPRFYLLLPAVLMPSYIGTGLFFHHLTLAESKGWAASWVTGNYIVYALFSIFTSLAAGPLIDRFSAKRIIPFYLLPTALGLALLIPAQKPMWVIPYMMLIGINTGIYFTAISALWAELYGPKFLGGIKALVGAMGVFASALGPVSIGVLLDNGYEFEQVCMMFIIFCIVSTLLLVQGVRRFD